MARLIAPGRLCVVGLVGAVCIGATFASQHAAARPFDCGAFGGSYGLIESHQNISCVRARRVAAAAYRSRAITLAADCHPPRVRHYGRWRIYGPISNGLTYRFTASGHRRFVTTKQSECSE